MIPWSHQSPQPKQHLDQCSRFSRLVVLRCGLIIKHMEQLWMCRTKSGTALLPSNTITDDSSSGGRGFLRGRPRPRFTVASTNSNSYMPINTYTHSFVCLVLHTEQVCTMQYCDESVCMSVCPLTYFKNDTSKSSDN